MRSLSIISTFIALCMVPVIGTSQSPFVGQKAPDFSLRYATRDSIASQPLVLSRVWPTSITILAFYPADWSSGCTKELCTFRDGIESLSRLDATVLAISGDYVYSHFEWAKHHSLPFRLLSDHDHTVAKAYESYNAGTGYNRRTVFVIDTAGTIAYTDLSYSVSDDQDFKLLRAALERVSGAK